jgi:two-component system sensor histidine kinase PhoQ
LSRGVRLDSQNHGQGIGLAMVADLVEGYKGEIKIEKSELGGCRFVVVI